MKLSNIFLGFSILLSASACQDALDTKTTFELSSDDVWRVPSMAQGVLYKAYNAISNRPDSYGNNFLDCATDNAVTRSYSSSVYTLGMGGVTEFNNPIGNWSDSYNMLQYVNEFLEKGLTDEIKYNWETEETDQAIKQRLSGEAYFLRAWWQFELLKVYGGKGVDGKAYGTPIVRHYISQEEAAQYDKFVRPSYQECVDSIAIDLDRAIKLLPDKYTGSDPNWGSTHDGRANRLAAAVFKSRVLLYSASPAFQDDDVVKITGMGEYQIVDEEKYYSKWKKVALEINKLFGVDGMPATFVPLTKEYLAGANDDTKSTDFVFRKYTNNKTMEQQHFPPFYYGNANTTPSLNLVKSFCLTSTGYPLGDDYEEWALNAGQYAASLDKRFSLNVYANGMNFADSNVPLDIAIGGKDSESFSEKATRTGFYLAKFLATKAKMLTPTAGSNSTHYYPLLRVMELFMNYAEAANEAWGPISSEQGAKTSKDIISDIRSQAGGITNDKYLADMSGSKENFRKLIQNERRVEFAFENHRYFDMRRWLLPLNEDVYGVKITKDEDGYTEYSKFTVEPRKFEVKNYYFPLPYTELKKNSNLINNLGWN